jgi:DNA-binding transcriptional regulator YhcF (GntR family)
MKFAENKSIYLQITDYVKEQILMKRWLKETKIPSVRDLAAQLEVNPNTVMRAYETLQQEGVIYNLRGVGNHVSADAGEKILKKRREEFLDTELPVLFKNMKLLGIGFHEIENHYKRFVSQSSL